MPLTRPQLYALSRVRASGYIKIADVVNCLGVSDTTARRYLSQAQHCGDVNAVDRLDGFKRWLIDPKVLTPRGIEDNLIANEEEPEEEEGRYITETIRVAESKSETRAAKRRCKELEDLLSGILDMDEYRLLAPRERRMERREPQGDDDEFVPVAMYSDVHFGEGVDPDSVNHLNFYNPDEAQRRSRNVAERTLTMIDRARKAGGKAKQMCLWWGGDFMQGYIHDSYLITNTLTPAEEQLVAFKVLAQQLAFYLDHGKFERIDVMCNPGNHARLTEKMVPAIAGKTSWEWVLYHLLRQMFKDDQRVHFHIATGYMLYHDILDTARICFHHGEAIRGGGGVGGLTVPLRRAIMKWNEQTPMSKQPFHIMGHFHQLLTDMRTFFCNGSVVGYNAYAMKLQCPFEPPQQGLCYIVNGQRVPVEFHRIYAND